MCQRPMALTASESEGQSDNKMQHMKKKTSHYYVSAATWALA